MLKRNITEYNFPEDLKKMNLREKELLAYDIRDYIIGNVSKTGGHLASSLGAVEIAIALHSVFESPHDKIIWDVGHQTYPHKILTGRADRFSTLRQFNGLSGFPKKCESEHDIFDTGHSSSSLSFAAGLAAARDLNKEESDIVAVIGDGALTGGLAYEALNNIGDSKTKIIVILNDNGMSISPNTGGVSKHLNRLRRSTKYRALKKNLVDTVTGIPNVGKGMYQNIHNIKEFVKKNVIENGILFEEIGFNYFGPIDGHDISELTQTLNMARQLDGPILIHAITKKGKGYVNAEKNPSKFHGTGPFDLETGQSTAKKGEASYSEVFGNEMISLASENDKIVAVAAAMIEGTGLEKFSSEFPKRTFDVGIAEEHAVTFAAGMARNGYSPVVSIYSTFLQRAYDQIMEDVCLQKLPVVFAIDRAGIVGADGETHHGIFDLSYLGHMPGMKILAPANRDELKAMLRYAVSAGEPCAIRYPRGAAAENLFPEKIWSPGRSLEIKTGKDVEIWAVGNMVNKAALVTEELKKKGIDAGLVNAGIVKPVDIETLKASAGRTKAIVTLEDNVVTGGFGTALAMALNEPDMKKASEVRLLNIGWPDSFIKHGTCEELMELYKLDVKHLSERICEFIEKKA